MIEPPDMNVRLTLKTSKKDGAINALKACNVCHISQKIKTYIIYCIDDVHTGFNKTRFDQKGRAVFDF